MLKRPLFAALGLFMLAAACQPGTQNQVGSGIPSQFRYNLGPGTVGFSEERLQRIDTFLQSLVDRQIVPFVSTFIARKGNVIHRKDYGFLDPEQRQPLPEDALFRMASQTKAITTVGMMMLWEKGLFLLDDPVSRYLPEFAEPMVLENFDEKTGEFTTRKADKVLKIRHLLTHTAGIPYGHPLYLQAEIPQVNALERFGFQTCHTTADA